MKPSPIYSVFSILVSCLSILSFVNKFDSIAFKFSLKMMQLYKKNFEDQIEKNKILNSRFIIKCE
jgi:hypothetical protein